MRLEVIVNPAAGRRRAALLAATLDALRLRGGSVRVRETGARGDAEAFAREAAARGDVDRLVVAGGDGTVGEAVNGLAGAALPLALIPAGTANVLARELGLPRAPAALAAAIVDGAARRVSTGLATTAAGARRFALMASAGADAEAVAAVNERLKRALGKGAYVLAALRVVATRAPARYALVADGTRLEAGLVVVANASRYAGGFTIAPGARLEASEFQLVTMRGSGALDLLRYAAALALGRFPRLADVDTRPARVVVIEGPAGAALQVDGDPAGTLPATIEILPASLTLVFPR